MSRPLTTRAFREWCEHPAVISERDREPWCQVCGLIFVEQDQEDDTGMGDSIPDWPATEAADRAERP